MKETDHGLKEQQITELFNQFDRDGSGYINYNEFLLAIRPPMSESRVKLIEQVFKRMDTNNHGVVKLDDIRRFFNPDRNHPDFQNDPHFMEQNEKSFIGM